MLKKNKSSVYLLLVLGLIVLIGGVLRFYGLDQKSLWLDEMASVRDSESVASMNEAAHPPLYYFILSLFRYMGTNEFILRLPSAIFGVLTIALVYKIGKLFFGIKEGLVSAFLLSISTFHVYYSQEARMYTLLTFLSSLSVFFFYKSIKENRKSLWLGFILSTILTLYTHFFGVFVVVFEIAFFILMTIKSKFPIKVKSKGIEKKTFLMFILSITIVSVFYVPFMYWKYNDLILSFLLGGSTQVASDAARVAPLQLSFIVKVFSEFSGGSPFSYGGPLLYLFLFFFLCGCVLSIKKDKEKLVLLLLWMALPILLVILTSAILVVYNEPRYVIYVLPVYLVIISKGITSIPEYLLTVSKRKTSLTSSIQVRNSKILCIAVFLIATVFVGSSITPLLGYYKEEKRDWRAIARYLEAKSQPEDVIVFDPNYLSMPFSYYFNNQKNVSVQKIYGSVSALEDIHHRYGRVWFVTGRPGTEMIEWLNQYSLWEKKFSGGLRVYFIYPPLLTQFEAAIFTNSGPSYISRWESTLSSVGASTTIFADTIKMSSVNMSEFDLIVFLDTKRQLDEGENAYLQESIDNGSIVIVSGLSPYWLAGGKTDLASISEWFGGTVFSEAPSKERYGTRFTTDANEIMEDLDISREYSFYTESDWSTPLAIITKSESVVYAYRDDGKATLFTHKFGNGTVIFNGVRYPFWSPDADVFQQFFLNLILSIIQAQ